MYVQKEGKNTGKGIIYTLSFFVITNARHGKIREIIDSHMF